MRYLYFWPLVLSLVLLAGCASSPAHRANSEKAADANANVGIDYVHKGQYDLAVTSLRKALRYNPDHINANWALGIAYNHLEEPEKANEYYQRAIDLQPRAQIINSYAVFLCQQGDTEKAVKYFKRATDSSDYRKPANAYANAGLCLMRAKRVADAEPYLRKALAHDPKQPTALEQMAQLSYNQGDYLKARGFIQRLDALGQMNDDALLLAARTELALNKRPVASNYLRRYNANHPGAELALSQL